MNLQTVLLQIVSVYFAGLLHSNVKEETALSLNNITNQHCLADLVWTLQQDRLRFECETNMKDKKFLNIPTLREDMFTVSPGV